MSMRLTLGSILVIHGKGPTKMKAISRNMFPATDMIARQGSLSQRYPQMAVPTINTAPWVKNAMPPWVTVPPTA